MLYPLSPGSDSYVIGSPLFANVTLDVGADKPLVVAASNQAPTHVYVQWLIMVHWIQLMGLLEKGT